MQRYDGSLLVLTPWRPFSDAPHDPRVIHTVGRLEDLEALADQGRSLGRATPGRPGADDLDAAPRLHRAGACATPAARSSTTAASRSRGSRCTCRWRDDLPPQRGRAADERRRGRRVSTGSPERPPRQPHGLGLPPHRGRARDPDARSTPTSPSAPASAPRCGSATAVPSSVRATVLDAHPVERGDTYGYRGRSAPRAGTILVVSGGTSHGIGLEAPTGDASLKAAGGLDRARWPRRGRVRALAVHRRRQAAALRRAPAHAGLDAVHPGRRAVPAVGDEIGCRVRFTATTFDEVEIS